jgi:multidrug resistance efflux pump
MVSNYTPEHANHHRSAEEPDHMRRSTLTSAVAACFGILTATTFASSKPKSIDEKSHVETSPNNMLVRSPKDGVVVSLEVADGATVYADTTVLCHIEPGEETRALNRLALSKQLIELEARALSEPQVAARRRLVEIATEITNKYLEYAEFKYADDLIQKNLGLINEVWLRQAEAAVTKARGEHEKAKLALEHFDFNISLMRERHQLISAQVPQEIEFLKQKLTRLEIKTPANGKIRFSVGKGSFVKMGGSLGTVEL